ncbi:MAG: long-chain-fatty-acid--CoA ligase [Sphingomonadaceae bacterium]
MFAHSLEQFHHRPLLDFMGRRYSYTEIGQMAQHFAAGLIEAGIGKGDRVGLFLPNIPVYVIAYYGAMMAGATLVNFSPLYSPEELAFQVEDSGTSLLVTVDHASLLPTALEVLDSSPLQRLVVSSMAAQLPWLKGLAMRWFRRDQLVSIPVREDIIRWDRIMGQSDVPHMELDAAQDVALLQYTGGTTGTPKGAILTHANLTANARQVDAIDPFPDADVILGALPLFHVFANTCVLNRTVVAGGCIVMLPRFDVKQVIDAINRTRPAVFPGVPTMYQALLDHPDIDKADFSSMIICVSGGAPLPAPLRERWEKRTNARLVEGYGLTESSGVVSVNPYQGRRKPGTIGQPLPDTRIALLDKEHPDRLAPADEPGELIVNGPQIMRGYWNRPDADASTFVTIDNRQWLRTGDIATIDEDGFATIVDRSKDMISVGGFKVFPSHVEAVLVEHPAVREALVMGVPEDYHGEVPEAYITTVPGSSATSDDIAEWLNLRVGKHERVRSVVIRDSLPKTMIGKLDRKTLRDEVLGRDEVPGQNNPD